MTPLVTVGLPFFRNAHTLEAAVRSVFAQTLDDWALVLLDDGGGDGSLELAHRVRDPRVTVVSDGANQGLPRRLNELTDRSTGRFIARMDADDVMHPERLARQVEHLERAPAVDVTGTAVVSVDDDLEPVGIRNREPLDVSPGTVLRHGLLTHPTVLGRAEWFRANPYDDRYDRAEDHELWVRTCGTTTFERLPEPLLFYREGRVSVRNYARSCRTDRRIYRTYGPGLVGGIL